MTPRDYTWIIYGGSSKHMTRQNKTLSKIEENKYPHKVSFGDDYQYPIKGIGEETYKLDYGTPMKMKECLYVLGLKKNLLSPITYPSCRR